MHLDKEKRERNAFPFLHDLLVLADNKSRGGMKMKEEKQEEKKPVPWEMVDPKPPIIQSGHMENRKR